MSNTICVQHNQTIVPWDFVPDEVEDVMEFFMADWDTGPYHCLPFKWFVHEVERIGTPEGQSKLKTFIEVEKIDIANTWIHFW